ncbi:hypothetical protein ETB97_012474 [Aspergillus alliaceus]|uniref:Uncharacterized protein n=1 Tax=Petromyces alliaceus TaxID=209559 RepID=A0A8H6AH49_PETAA|nr:hypothetical protein ETB97_012474 [Aspergillus burnettii]
MAVAGSSAVAAQSFVIIVVGGGKCAVVGVGTSIAMSEKILLVQTRSVIDMVMTVINVERNKFKKPLVTCSESITGVLPAKSATVALHDTFSDARSVRLRSVGGLNRTDLRVWSFIDQKEQDSIYHVQLFGSFSDDFQLSRGFL